MWIAVRSDKRRVGVGLLSSKKLHMQAKDKAAGVDASLQRLDFFFSMWVRVC